MRSISFIAIVALTAAVLSLSACGGGGSGGGGGGGGGAPNTTIGNFTAVLLDFFTGGTTSTATDINAANNAIGYGDDALGSLKAASWSVDTLAGTIGAPVQLAPLAGGANNHSAAFAVNDTGTVAGESDDSGSFTAVVWSAGSSTATALQKGTLANTSAYGINAGGQIVGEGGSGGATRAILWNDETAAPVELGNLPTGSTSSAYAISDSGIVVGEADDGTEPRAVAWLVTPTGTVSGPFDLGQIDPFDISSAAYSANDLGEIVGESVASNGVAHAVEWTIDTTSGAVLSTTDLGAATADSTAYANNLGNRIVGYDSQLGAATATAWDNRAPTVAKAILTTAGPSQSFGINEDHVTVGVDGAQGFVAIPQ